VTGRANPSRNRPYCWQEKAVRRAIRDVFDVDGQKASALEIYSALCEIASNEQSDTFTASHDKIASFAGLVGKTSKRIMPTFEKMEIVHVQRNGSDGLQTSSTYTLLPCPSIFCPQGLKVPAQGQKPKSDLSHVLNNPSEESPEKSDDDKANGEKRSTESSSSNSEWISEAEENRFWPEYLRFCKSRNGSPTRKGWGTWRAKQVVVKSPAPKKPKKVEPSIPTTSDEDRAKILQGIREEKQKWKAELDG
jgi:hypothetical protein